jgi:hypothetical protein
MKNKATHNGTCQCCGNSQAVSPLLSNHGYTVDFGYFNGTCRGANAQPLEESRDLSDKLVLELRNEAKRLAALTSENIKSITIKVSNNRFRHARIEATETVSSQEEINLLCETHEHSELFEANYGENSYHAKYSGNNFADKSKAQLELFHRQSGLMKEHAETMYERANLTTGKKALEPRAKSKDKVRFNIPNRRRHPIDAKAGWDRVEAMKESGEFLRVTTRRERYNNSYNAVATPK